MNIQQDIIPKKDGTPYVILLVEDRDVNQIMGKTLLEKLGCHVVIANNGQEAVEQFQSQSFDLILMDCRMPVLDGYAATKKIRQLEEESGKGRAMPIVALTSQVMTGDRAMCINAGMDDYLSKPIRKEGVCTIINKWCGSVIDYREMW